MKASITFEQTLMQEAKSACDRYRKQFVQSSGAISEGTVLAVSIASISVLNCSYGEQRRDLVCLLC